MTRNAPLSLLAALVLSASALADPHPGDPLASEPLPSLASLLTSPSRGGASATESEAKPWRLQSALGSPKWLQLSGSQRTRYEVLRNQFRAGRTGDDDVLLLRTTLRANLLFSPFEVTLEGMDSRSYGSDATTPLDTSLVNAVELIQAYAGVRFSGLFEEQDEAFVLLGRHTMDVGSRRLVARNAFRNTTNTFTGLNATWKDADGEAVRAFVVRPVNRLPTDAPSLDDNELAFDEDARDTWFLGLHASTEDLGPGLHAEAYYFYLDESDAVGEGTRDRRLHTPGVRVQKKPAQGQLDFEVEAVYQFGSSHASASSADVSELDHRAHFEHLGLGYSFGGEWSPRLVAELDYASGDDSPTDASNERFDTLFGARRFDFGPTGTYGAFARSNVVSPGLRLFLKPSSAVELMAADRCFWLASDTDAWTTAGVRDASGATGDYVGNQIEVQARWHVVPKSFDVELGLAHLFQGEFAEDAPNANGEDDPTFAYLQLSLTF